MHKVYWWLYVLIKFFFCLYPTKLAASLSATFHIHTRARARIHIATHYLLLVALLQHHHHQCSCRTVSHHEVITLMSKLHLPHSSAQRNFFGFCFCQAVNLTPTSSANFLCDDFIYFSSLVSFALFLYYLLLFFLFIFLLFVFFYPFSLFFIKYYHYCYYCCCYILPQRCTLTITATNFSFQQLVDG